MLEVIRVEPKKELRGGKRLQQKLLVLKVELGQQQSPLLLEL
jgi:hypothetical protein